MCSGCLRTMRTYRGLEPIMGGIKWKMRWKPKVGLYVNPEPYRLLGRKDWAAVQELGKTSNMQQSHELQSMDTGPC